MSDQRPERLNGLVSSQFVRRGTSGAYTAQVLTTDDGEELILQRIGSNPYADPAGEGLVGHRVTVEGHRLNRVFRYLNAETESDTQKP